MYKEGTMVVLAYVAKQNAFFKASDVFSETGLERALVYYHLGKFVEKGYLEKQGLNYCVLDRNSLIEALAYGKKTGKKRYSVNTAIFKNSEPLNETIDLVIASRALSLPGSRELKEELNEVIDKTIETLKNAKRGLNTRQIKPIKAEKLIEKLGGKEAFKLRLETFDVELNEGLLEAAFSNMKKED